MTPEQLEAQRKDAAAAERDSSSDVVRGALSDVRSWFPGMPRVLKILFGSFVIYACICLFFQLDIAELPDRLYALSRQVLDAQIKSNTERRQAMLQERRDLVRHLQLENAALRAGTAAVPLSQSAVTLRQDSPVVAPLPVETPDSLRAEQQALTRRMDYLDSRIELLEHRSGIRPPAPP